ncbi:MAG: plastocyanin/azurin family copper-binding protein [Actinomycetota bacterium]
MHNWGRVAKSAALANLAVMAVAAALIADLEAVAVAVGFGLAALLFRWRERLGATATFLLSAIVLFFMGTAAVSNLRAREPLPDLIVPVTLMAVSFVGVVAGLGALVNAKGRAPGALIAGIAGGLWAVALLSAFLLGGPAAAGTGSVVVSENVEFDVTVISLPGPAVSIHMANRDLFWHSFTIDELGVDLLVPVNGERTASFTGSPGTYRFYCRIPGHASAGMVGTLTITG